MTPKFPTKHFLLPAVLCLASATALWLGTSPSALAGLIQLSQPTLSIPDRVPAQRGGTVTVPVTFNSGGHAIASTVFSVDYDQTWLAFDPTDSDGDGIPDDITLNVPAAFTVVFFFNADDTDGELDFAIADLGPPFASLSSGVVVSMTFTTGTPPSTTPAAVNFSQSPAASFGNTQGQSVPGATDNGSVLIVVPAPCYSLTTNVIPNGGGRVDPNPPRNCESGTKYISGTVVTLSAVPNSGYRFDHWSGAVTGTVNPTTVTMNTTKSVTATFALTSRRIYLPLIRNNFPPPPPPCSVFTSADVPKPIPDNLATGVASVLAVPGPSVFIRDLTLRLDNLRHTYDSDLQISLIAPDGTAVLLVDRVGSDGDNFIGTHLNDNSPTPIVNGTAPFTGRFRPDRPLSDFRNKPSAGTWTLHIADREARDVGELKAWSLEICR